MTPGMLAALSLLTLAPAVSAAAGSADDIRVDAAITFTGRYQVSCPVELVAKAVNHPVLLGALWSSFGYAPAYQISPTADAGTVRVSDPTGIVGNMRLVEHSGTSWVYLAEGKIEHWAAPALNQGQAVFEVEAVQLDSLTELTVSVFVNAENYLAAGVLRLLEPIIVKHVDNRVTLNFQDAARILEAIHRLPEQVAKRLSGPTRSDFDRLFGG